MSPSCFTWIAGSASTFSMVFCTSAGASPGRMRQFTLARASCGSAFCAWPASEHRRHAGRAHERVVEVVRRQLGERGRRRVRGRRRRGRCHSSTSWILPRAAKHRARRCRRGAPGNRRRRAARARRPGGRSRCPSTGASCGRPGSSPRAGSSAKIFSAICTAFAM